MGCLRFGHNDDDVKPTYMVMMIITYMVIMIMTYMVMMMMTYMVIVMTLCNHDDYDHIDRSQ